jgi:DNA-binding transcriptional regulator YiaG
MSQKLSLKEALAQQAGGKGSSLARSGSHEVRVLLDAPGEIRRPVDVVRALHAAGLSLRKSREQLDRLAENQRVAVVIQSDDPDNAIEQLRRLDLRVRVLRVPDADVKEVRERFQLTQAEFATRFGLELDTVRNWEQGRNKLDAQTRLLLRIIDRFPETVEDLLAESGAQAAKVSGSQRSP